MAYEVTHPNQLIRELAMDYIAGLEDGVSKGFGTYKNEVTFHDHKPTACDSGMYRRRKLTGTNKST